MNGYNGHVNIYLYVWNKPGNITLQVALLIMQQQPCLENVQFYFDIQPCYQNKNIYVHK